MTTWFKRHRVEWIVESIQIFGFINREHVMRKFDVSTPQASMDIQDAIRNRPDLFAYNASAKRYELRVRAA